MGDRPTLDYQPGTKPRSPRDRINHICVIITCILLPMAVGCLAADLLLMHSHIIGDFAAFILRGLVACCNVAGP